MQFFISFDWCVLCICMNFFMCMWVLISGDGGLWVVGVMQVFVGGCGQKMLVVGGVVYCSCFVFFLWLVVVVVQCVIMDIVYLCFLFMFDLFVLFILLLGYYCYFKGGNYEVFGIVWYSEIFELMVLYCFFDVDIGVWV